MGLAFDCVPGIMKTLVNSYWWNPLCGVHIPFCRVIAGDLGELDNNKSVEFSLLRSYIWKGVAPHLHILKEFVPPVKQLDTWPALTEGISLEAEKTLNNKPKNKQTKKPPFGPTGPTKKDFKTKEATQTDRVNRWNCFTDAGLDGDKASLFFWRFPSTCSGC